MESGINSSDQDCGSPRIRIVSANNLSCATCSRHDSDGFSIASTNPNKFLVVHFCVHCIRKLAEFFND